MQRRTSQTFQRIRKLSDSIIQAVVPNSAGKPGGDDSFFDYGKKGWHAPPKPPDTALRRRPSHRKVSKEDIRYPLLHSSETYDLLVESATMSAERDKERTRPARPSHEERPLVVRDPQLRREEQEMYRSANTAKRPERPREEDLPYGAKGSIPKALVQEERYPPPAAAVRKPKTVPRSSSLPFPSSQTTPTKEQSARRLNGGEKGVPKGGRGDLRPEPPPQTKKIFNPFAPMSPTESQKRAGREKPSVRPTDFAGPSSLAVPWSAPIVGSTPVVKQTELRRRGTVPDPERKPRVPPKDAKWLQEDIFVSTGPAQVRRHGAIRRISSSGDVNLPPQHSRYRQAEAERKNKDGQQEPRSARPPRPELRTVKSTPLSPRKGPTNPYGNRPGLPAHPAVHLERVRSKPKSRDLDIPQDVTPVDTNPQRLPTPRGSEEEARPLFARHRDSLADRAPRLIPSAPIATAAVVAKARANLHVKEASAPRAVKVGGTPEHARPISHYAQVRQVQERPREREAEKEKERERQRERRRREKEEEREDEESEVRFYGAADSFARQIALALAEPDYAAPMPIDWEKFTAGGKDYGTKPLATKKVREAAKYPGATR